MCRAMEEMRNEAVRARDKEQISKKLRKGFSPEQIHEDDEYPMELIREVEKELCVLT